MKSYEVIDVNKKSIFKTTIYVMSIPLAIMAAIGIIITIISVLTGNTAMLVFGIPYIVMPVFMLFIYGLLSMLMALVYNKFAKKFGGLELKLVEKSSSDNPSIEGSKV